MKRSLSFGLLALQAACMCVMSLMFWSNPGHTGESYAQFAAVMIGFPAIAVSAALLGLVYKMRLSLPEDYRDKILMGSAAMLVVTVLAVGTGFMDLSPS